MEPGKSGRLGSAVLAVATVGVLAPAVGGGWRRPPLRLPGPRPPPSGSAAGEVGDSAAPAVRPGVDGELPLFPNTARREVLTMVEGQSLGW